MYEHRKPMDSKRKHPFQIVCRMCGSNIVKITSFDCGDIDITCGNCGFTLNCGGYHTMNGDYTNFGYSTALEVTNDA